MNQFTHLVAVLGISLPALISPALAEENKPSAEEFINDGFLALLNIYNTQLGDTLAKNSESQEVMAAAIKALTEDSDKLWTRCEEAMKKPSPEFEKGLVEFFKKSGNAQKVRLAIFQLRFLQIFVVNNREYYGHIDIRDICQKFDKRIIALIDYVNRHRFATQKNNLEMVKNMALYQDREMVIHDLHHILNDLINKKISTKEAEKKLYSYNDIFYETRGFIRDLEDENKNLAKKAYDASGSEKWTKKQIDLLKKRTETLKKAKKTEYENVIRLASMYLKDI